MFKARREQAERVKALIARANSYAGYRSRPNRVTEFGARVGFDGRPWSGSFLSEVFRAEGLWPGCSLTSTVAALGYFVRTGRVHMVPKPGDIAFLAYSSDGERFEQPVAGIVTDTRHFVKYGTFSVIAGQMNPGTAKGHPEENGVYERTMTISDVLMFARPDYRPMPKAPEHADSPRVRLLDLKSVQTKRRKAAWTLVQKALHEYLGATGMEKGVHDRATQHALRRFQVEVGILDGDGQPTQETLVALALLTDHKIFQAPLDTTKTAP